MNDIERLKSERDWFGYLTLENANVVADRIRSMLGDGQRYTWVSAYEYSGYRPEVRTSQIAEKVTFTRKDLEDGQTWVHLMVVDTYGVWGLDTVVADMAAVENADRRDLTRMSFGDRKLMVDQYAPDGGHMYWVVALEDAPDGGAS